MECRYYLPENIEYSTVYNIISADWQRWAAETGATKFVIGISGGKDSTVVAALATRIFGKENVLGVMMPNGEQKDIADSERVIDFLGINAMEINISGAYDAILGEMQIRSFVSTDDKDSILTIKEDTTINLPARLRTATLFAIAQSWGGRVINTCNLSEDMLGYSTIFGDDAGLFAPLHDLTATEVMYLGDYLELPHDLVFKTPSDGLCGQTDEDKLGFSYYEFDTLYRTGYYEDWNKVVKMVSLMKKNQFKRQLIHIPHPYIPEGYLTDAALEEFPFNIGRYE